jgi:hypothetical protein
MFLSPVVDALLSSSLLVICKGCQVYLSTFAYYKQGAWRSMQEKTKDAKNQCIPAEDLVSVDRWRGLLGIHGSVQGRCHRHVYCIQISCA